MIKRLLLFLCLAVVLNTVTGQNVKRYTGMMQLPSDLNCFKGVIFGWRNISGEGYYDYYENSDGDRVKHGKFYLKSHGYEFNGSYSHGMKEGQWTVMPPNEKGYVKTNYNKLKITFKNDVINGPCEYISRPTQGLPATVTVLCNFTNGILTGDASVKYKYDYNSITSECSGKIDENGLLYGVWITSDKGGIEFTKKSTYYKGALIYVEEKDFSTGERTVCYSAFENEKKAPDLDQIKDTVIYGQNGIVYNNYIAIITSSYNYKSSSHVRSGVTDIIYNLPDGLMFSELLSQQRANWGSAYSEKAFNQLLEKQKEKRIADSIQRERRIADSIQNARLIRERQIADSIRNAKLIQEQQIKEARGLFENFLYSIKRDHIIEKDYFGFKSMETQNTDGKIKKCSVSSGEIVFKIGTDTIKGSFDKSFVKTSAGERFYTYPPVELLSNRDGSMLIYRYGRNENCVLLIVREGEYKGVYSLSSSAQKCIEF